MQLAISLNARRVDGPYGGGNQFAAGLEDYLRGKGHRVSRHLPPGLDLILIVSSRWHYRTTSYGSDAVRDYVTLNPNTTVVHRVNSSDEPRGQDLGINAATMAANELADHTVFISAFIRDLFGQKGMDTTRSHSVILNGADERVFHPQGRAEWRRDRKLRLVTHHWSTHYMKGFDIYERLDQLLAVKPFEDLFEFAYIGNVPPGVEFKHTRVERPTGGSALADLIRQHHVYLTGARHEAAGMHHIEGMRCGLPPLFLASGATPEYCRPYGVEFRLSDFERKLFEMRERYSELEGRVLACPYTATRMAAEYEALFLGLAEARRARPRPELNPGQRLLARCRSHARRSLRGIGLVREKTARFMRRG